jgi:soluble lytic murein transglycosylase-like protein
MQLTRRAALGLVCSALILSACGIKTETHAPPKTPHSGDTPEMRALIKKWAKIHDIPESLLHRMIQRESGYNAGARNGPYYGLLQILPQTAQQMGYRGDPDGLLDAETNLHYAGRYLRGAWIVSNGNQDRAEMWYSKGYYYEAKRRGLLYKTGLRS